MFFRCSVFLNNTETLKLAEVGLAKLGLAKVGHPNFGQSRSIKVGQSRSNFFGRRFGQSRIGQSRSNKDGQSRFGQSRSQPLGLCVYAGLSEHGSPSIADQRQARRGSCLSNERRVSDFGRGKSVQEMSSLIGKQGLRSPPPDRQAELHHGSQRVLDSVSSS